MTDSLFNLLFLCPHRKTTFPFTPRRAAPVSVTASSPGRTYVVCLDCGKEFRYDWKEMRIAPAAMTTGPSLASLMRQALQPLLRFFLF